MANAGQFTWTVGGPQLQHMLSATSRGQRFKSKPIEMCHLKWRIDCSPRDGDDDDNASFKIFLTILDFPATWSKLIVQRHIQLIQTRACSTTLSTYTHEHKSGGWKSRSQLLRELRELHIAQIDIRIKIRVLQIIESHSHRTIYRDISTPVNETYICKFHLNETHHSYELQLLRNASFGKRFESSFDSKRDIFCILCFPQGSRREYAGYISVYLNLVQFPVWNAKKMQLSYSIKCLETSTQKSGSYTLHSNHSNPGFPKFCKFSELFTQHSQHTHSITFRAEVNVLSIWDAHDQQIPKSHWNRVWNTQHKFQYAQCLPSPNVSEEKLDEMPGSLPLSHVQLPPLQEPPQPQSQSQSLCMHAKYKENVCTEQVKRWLTETVALPQYIENFVEHGFDDLWTIIQTMDEHDLSAMGIHKRGHCKKIIHIINNMRHETGVGLQLQHKPCRKKSDPSQHGEQDDQVEGAHFVETVEQ